MADRREERREAFRQAQEEDKPILLDIGAIWCHWCHVMDVESYENEAIAALINENFVAIKVDRDERPDIEQDGLVDRKGMIRKRYFGPQTETALKRDVEQLLE